MKFLKRSIIVQLQCYFWIVFMAFATIGCSVKKTFFEAFAISVDIPASGSKAVTTSVSSSCDVEVFSNEKKTSRLSEQKVTPLFAVVVHTTSDLVAIPVKKIFKKGYLLQLAGNSPPLYVLLKQFKFALL